MKKKESRSLDKLPVLTNENAGGAYASDCDCVTAIACRKRTVRESLCLRSVKIAMCVLTLVSRSCAVPQSSSITAIHFARPRCAAAQLGRDKRNESRNHSQSANAPCLNGREIVGCVTCRGCFRRSQRRTSRLFFEFRIAPRTASDSCRTASTTNHFSLCLSVFLSFALPKLNCGNFINCIEQNFSIFFRVIICFLSALFFFFFFLSGDNFKQFSFSPSFLKVGNFTSGPFHVVLFFGTIAFHRPCLPNVSISSDPSRGRRSRRNSIKKLPIIILLFCRQSQVLLLSPSSSLSDG